MITAKCGCVYTGGVQFCSLHAAAPELLKACKALMLACMEADAAEELSEQIDGSLIDAAQHAVAKAEGR